MRLSYFDEEYASKLYMIYKFFKRQPNLRLQSLITYLIQEETLTKNISLTLDNIYHPFT